MRKWVPIAAVLLLACTAKAKLVTETTQLGSSLTVKISVDPPASGTLTFKGSPAFEKLGPQTIETNRTLELNVPAAGLPAGKNTVAMHFEGKGHGLAKEVKSDGTLTFERKAATPEPWFMPSPSARADGPTLPCSGTICGKSSLPLGPDGKLYVDITRCDGCTIEAGPQKIVVKGDPFPAVIDMTNVLATVKLAGLNGLSETKLPFKVTQGSDSGEQAIEGKAYAILTPLVRRVSSGGILFSGETAAASTAPKAAVLVRTDGSIQFRVVGTPATMRDVDLIGIATVTEKSLGSCGIYEGEKTKTKVDVSHSGQTHAVTMYDRRTGKPLGQRTFPYENAGCADTLIGKTVTSMPKDETIVAWAKGFLR